MKLPQKQSKIKNSMVISTYSAPTEEKGKTPQTHHVTDDDGRILAEFVTKDGEALQASGTQDVQESGQFQKLATKAGYKDDVIHTTPGAVAMEAYKETSIGQPEKATLLKKADEPKLLKVPKKDPANTVKDGVRTLDYSKMKSPGQQTQQRWQALMAVRAKNKPDKVPDPAVSMEGGVQTMDYSKMTTPADSKPQWKKLMDARKPNEARVSAKINNDKRVAPGVVRKSDDEGDKPESKPAKLLQSIKSLMPKERKSTDPEALKKDPKWAETKAKMAGNNPKVEKAAAPSYNQEIDQKAKAIKAAHQEKKEPTLQAQVTKVKEKYKGFLKKEDPNDIEKSKGSKSKIPSKFKKLRSYLHNLKKFDVPEWVTGPRGGDLGSRISGSAVDATKEIPKPAEGAVAAGAGQAQGQLGFGKSNDLAKDGDDESPALKALRARMRQPNRLRPGSSDAKIRAALEGQKDTNPYAEAGPGGGSRFSRDTHKDPKYQGALDAQSEKTSARVDARPERSSEGDEQSNEPAADRWQERLKEGEKRSMDAKIAHAKDILYRHAHGDEMHGHRAWLENKLETDRANQQQPQLPGDADKKIGALRIPGTNRTVAYHGQDEKGNHYFTSKGGRDWNGKQFVIGADKQIKAIPEMPSDHHVTKWNNDGTYTLRANPKSGLKSYMQQASASYATRGIAAAMSAVKKHPKFNEVMGRKVRDLGPSEHNPRDYEIKTYGSEPVYSQDGGDQWKSIGHKHTIRARQMKGYTGSRYGKPDFDFQFDTTTNTYSPKYVRDAAALENHAKVFENVIKPHMAKHPRHAEHGIPLQYSDDAARKDLDVAPAAPERKNLKLLRSGPKPVDFLGKDNDEESPALKAMRERMKQPHKAKPGSADSKIDAAMKRQKGGRIEFINGVKHELVQPTGETFDERVARLKGSNSKIQKLMADLKAKAPTKDDGFWNSTEKPAPMNSYEQHKAQSDAVAGAKSKPRLLHTYDNDDGSQLHVMMATHPDHESMIGAHHRLEQPIGPDHATWPHEVHRSIEDASSQGFDRIILHAPKHEGAKEQVGHLSVMKSDDGTPPPAIDINRARKDKLDKEAINPDVSTKIDTEKKKRTAKKMSFMDIKNNFGKSKMKKAQSAERPTAPKAPSMPASDGVNKPKIGKTPRSLERKVISSTQSVHSMAPMAKDSESQAPGGANDAAHGTVDEGQTIKEAFNALGGSGSKMSKMLSRGKTSKSTAPGEMSKAWTPLLTE